jgi:surface antigen
MEVIICTPANSGRLVTQLHQNSALVESSKGSKRGHVQGDAPKTNLKQKQNVFNSKKISGRKPEIKNNLLSLLHPSWVGVVVSFGLLTSLFLSAPKAHAATNDWNNLTVVKALASAQPVVTPVSESSSVATDQAADDFIEKPFVAETSITPPDPVRVLGVSYKRAPVDYSLVAGPHYFPYGYCTYYVSQKRTVTWSGNAGTWLGRAISSGMATGKEPKPGAIVVTAEGGRVGHVAYVENVSDGKITVSEMNFKGFGVVSTRTLAQNSKVIKGYIY